VTAPVSLNDRFERVGTSRNCNIDGLSFGDAWASEKTGHMAPV
jgi:hypothetical protein